MAVTIKGQTIPNNQSLLLFDTRVLSSRWQACPSSKPIMSYRWGWCSVITDDQLGEHLSHQERGGEMLTGGTRKAETIPLLKKADSQEITLGELLEVCLQNICLAPKSLGWFRGWKLNRGLWLHKILVKSLTVSTQKGNNILLPKRGWNKRSLYYVWHSPFHFIKKP